MKQTQSQDRLLLRVDEVASAIGVSRATAYDLINRGELPSVRLCGRGGRGMLRVPAEALRKLIEERTGQVGALR
ncbi:MAG: helix-turn-helix transcriptional regulator [Candidatus Binataceae bacterium]